MFIEDVVSNTHVTKKATMPWKNNRQTRRETEEILVKNEPGQINRQGCNGKDTFI